MLKIDSKNRGVTDSFSFSLGALVSFSCSEPSKICQRGWVYKKKSPKNVRFRFSPATLAKSPAHSLGGFQVSMTRCSSTVFASLSSQYSSEDEMLSFRASFAFSSSLQTLKLCVILERPFLSTSSGFRGPGKLPRVGVREFGYLRPENRQICVQKFGYLRILLGCLCPKIWVFEGRFYRLRIAQELNPELKRHEQKKTRQIRWETAVKKMEETLTFVQCNQRPPLATTQSRLEKRHCTSPFEA